MDWKRKPKRGMGSDRKREPEKERGRKREPEGGGREMPGKAGQTSGTLRAAPTPLRCFT